MGLVWFWLGSEVSRQWLHMQRSVLDYGAASCYDVHFFQRGHRDLRVHQCLLRHCNILYRDKRLSGERPEEFHQHGFVRTEGMRWSLLLYRKYMRRRTRQPCQCRHDQCWGRGAADGQPAPDCRSKIYRPFTVLLYQQRYPIPLSG